MLLMVDVHPKIVQEILGHSEIGMAMDIYLHVLPTMQKDAMDKLQDALKQREDGDDGMADAGVPSKPQKIGR
jgi:integrase